MAYKRIPVKFTDYTGYGYESDGLYLPSQTVNWPGLMNHRGPVVEDSSENFFENAKQNPDKSYVVVLGLMEIPLYQDWEKLEYTINKLVPLKNVHVEIRNSYDIQEHPKWTRENKLKYACRNIEEERLTFVVNNMLTIKKLKNFFRKSTIEFESDFLPRFHRTTDPYLPFKGHRQNHFICLNSRITHHRDVIYNFLKDKNNSILSYRLRGIFLEENNPWNNNQKEIFKEHPEYLDLPHGHFAEDSDNNWQKYQDRLEPKYYNDACIYVCTETLCGSFMHDSSQGMLDKSDNVTHWFTEKVFKSFYYKLPMIVVGMPYVLEALRMLGFRTWNNFWDESYDWKMSEEQRLSIITTQLEELSNKSIEQLNDMYYSDDMQEILNHNHKLFNHMYDKYLE